MINVDAVKQELVRLNYEQMLFNHYFFGIDLQTIEEMAEGFEVSFQATAMRLMDGSLGAEDSRIRIWQDYFVAGWANNEKRLKRKWYIPFYVYDGKQHLPVPNRVKKNEFLYELIAHCYDVNDYNFIKISPSGTLITLLPRWVL